MKFAILLPLVISLAFYLYNRYFITLDTPSDTSENLSKMASVAKFAKNANPFPTYFFSHGGPTFIYENDDFGNKGAWNTIKKLGTNIKKNLKPDYIIVVSAHWQSSGSNLIEIAIPKKRNQENELIYDFYGFPNHMYKEQFHSKNSYYVAEQIKQHLEEKGFNSTLTERGVDHGVWVPFKVAFSDYNTLTKNPPENPGLDLPDTAVIQVSLTSNDRDFVKHFKLGEALSTFRENLLWDEEKKKYLTGLVICSGMSVHNLRDLGRSFSQPGGVMPYVKPFNKLLTDTLTKSDDLLDGLLKLQTNNKTLLYNAHPTLEHLVPVVVASGIANNKLPVKELYNDQLASLGWGVYQFGPDVKL
ncbi:Extradiol ring-cleavage dioxygenase, class III enzyme, subunit B [Scheffersomyces xylosifermentans]|uniref:Extradiol ring-cleavage dioxygenase, class III enzyme, subunit B n=1 Tax=Scheffersomyces xylosifermentans TaxID=1304137 RepID=UPI00315C973C